MKKGNLKVLVIRFSSIGDIVLTSPVLRCIKQQVPDVQLHYLTKKAFEPVLAGNPFIDKLHFLKDKRTETLAELRSEGFDYIIDLHHNLRTLMLKLTLGVRSSSFNKLNWQKWLLVNVKRNNMPPVHIVDRYLQTVDFLGVKNDGKGLDYFLMKDHKLELLVPSTHQKYIALVIGAQHATKRLPVKRLIELCKSINKQIILLGGPADQKNGEAISTASGEHVFNGCGLFTLDESAFLVKNAEQVITHDTGLMHIAAAFNKPIISVWGNTVPDFGMYPYKVDDSVIAQVEGLPCRPCSKIGYEKCPLGHFKCMNDIDLQFITTYVNG